MPQLTLDIIQTPEMLFCHSPPELAVVFSLSFSATTSFDTFMKWDVMANEKQIEGNFVWWREGS